MKLFKIKLDNVEYDTYSDCIIAAPSKEDLENKIKSGYFKSFRDRDWQDNDSEFCNAFEIEHFQHYEIEEINLETLNEFQVICSSYHAG